MVSFYYGQVWVFYLSFSFDNSAWCSSNFNFISGYFCSSNQTVRFAPTGGNKVFICFALSITPIACPYIYQSPTGKPYIVSSLLLSISGLFTKKYGLIFKGSAASAPTHSQRHLHARPPARLWRGLRPRLCFARAIFSPFGRVRDFHFFHTPPVLVQKTNSLLMTLHGMNPVVSFLKQASLDQNRGSFDILYTF